MDATWQRLGDAAGTKGVGLNRVRVAPGKLPTPPHSHGASEEIFYVLEGSGLAWQDDRVHEVRPGDCVIHRANELEHTFVAGPNGLDCSSSGRGIRRTSAGCRARARSARTAVDRGAGGRSLGPRGRGAAARVRRAGGAAAEHPQRRRGRARALGRGDVGAARNEGALRPGGVRLGAARSRARAARCRTATPRRRRSSSCSRARGRSTSGRHPRSRREPAPSGRRSRSAPATWSRGRRRRASATGSAPARAG